MIIDVIGCGSAYAKTRNTSSLLIADNSGQQWLIDCGPTVPRALFSRNIDINSIGAIYFTHIHPDHCAGIPALISYWNSFKRTAPLTIFCQAEQREALSSLISLAHGPAEKLCFQLDWHQITDSFSWNNWKVETALTQHELANRSLLISADGQQLFYSGDGRPTPASTRLMERADLAFQECACFQPLADDSSHGDFFSCKALLEKTRVPLLGLYHCWDEEVDAITCHAEQVENMFVSSDGLKIDMSALNQLP